MAYEQIATAYALASGTAGVAAVAAPTDKNKGTLVLYGWSIHEDAGAPAVAALTIRNGTAATDAIVAVIELAANASETRFFDKGVECNSGIYVDRNLGSTEGAIYYGYNV